jgi:hypothetical protein
VTVLLSGCGEPAGLLNLGGIANLTAARPDQPAAGRDRRRPQARPDVINW